jgi:hypothetical protein
MALTKVTGKGITCSAVTEDKLGTSAVTTNKIGPDAVTSAKINNGAVTADDLASTLDLSSKTVTLPSDVVSDLKRPVQDNIALLGFKMAVNDGLTIFNLVDGVVDEFNDESGTDEAEGSNDIYCGTSDFYQNLSAPVPISAGFSMSTITEPDTSVSSTNPANGSGTFGTFTVPSGLTSVAVKVWGAGGGGGYNCGTFGGETTGGGGGGYAAGTLAVTSEQTIYVNAGEGANGPAMPVGPGYMGFYNGPGPAEPTTPGVGGGGLSGLFSVDISTQAIPCHSAPTAFIVAGSGGSGNYNGGGPQDDYHGGAGGGLTGCAGGPAGAEQTANRGPVGEIGGGGSQSAGGQGGVPSPGPGQGTLFKGGRGGGSGGAGFYGGGAGNFSPGPGHGSGGGGSSYYSHPQVSCGSTEEGSLSEGGGVSIPGYTASTNEGSPVGSNLLGEDGFVLITGTATGSTTSTTIVSTAFTSSSVATSARIVVFEENVDSPTLNTDIIASVSRDGTNFTNATLTDSGYVTGSSGQRILTGQADISGQPSGQSMRWKLALANNTVKIHGVALQWS